MKNLLLIILGLIVGLGAMLGFVVLAVRNLLNMG